jgi:hypothetical protein
MFALIHKNIVKQVEEKPFPVSPSLTWVEINPGETVLDGYIWDGGGFTQPENVIVDPKKDSVDDLLTAVTQTVLGEKSTAELRAIYQKVKPDKVK